MHGIQQKKWTDVEIETLSGTQTKYRLILTELRHEKTVGICRKLRQGGGMSSARIVVQSQNSEPE